MMNDLSQSEKHRQCGNKHYKSVTPGLSPVLQKSRLEKARQCYTDALNCSPTTKEAAFANKNLAMTTWKLASLGHSQNDSPSQIMFFYKESLKYFSEAFDCGSIAQNDQSWSQNLVDTMYQSLQECHEYVNQRNMSDEKFDFISIAWKLFPTGEFKATLSILYVELLIEKALHPLPYSKCLSIISDCYQPLQEARRYGGRNRDILSEVDVLSKEVMMLESEANARQALETGDNLKMTKLMMEEDLNIDMVWEVLDWYKKAILLTREMNLELEAIAMSRMGIVYDKMLKMKSKAREYFKGSITLAHSLHPRVFTNDEWYQVCTQTLEAYQIQTVTEETRKWQKEREETVKKLQPEIEKFKDIRDNFEFMKYIYKNYPPKNKYKLPEKLTKPSQVKKCLQTAILHYHPDRNSKDKFGKEWHILCEEIIKVLNVKYHQMKGIED